jgi:hypothetical protein
MRKSVNHKQLIVALLLVVGASVAFAACGGGDGDPATRAGLSTPTPTVAALMQGPTTADAGELSTFRSKDPFIQQAVEITTPSTEPPSGGNGGSTPTIVKPPVTSPVTSRYSPETTYRPTVTTKPTSATTKPTSTTTTKPTSTTTTTAPHVHTIKILSVGDVGGAPAVTFQVDGSVYKDKRVGDVVSTSWGQIKVLDLSSSSKIATLLHGSETLILSVGQVVYQ